MNVYWLWFIFVNAVADMWSAYGHSSGFWYAFDAIFVGFWIAQIYEWYARDMS